MKYLKIDLFQPPGEKIKYPVNYQPEVGNHATDHLYYDEGADLKLLLVIPDKSYKLGMVRENVTEITEAEAKQISESKEVREEVIGNEAVIRKLEIKSKTGEKLTDIELKSLDPDDDEPGITRVKILADRIAEKKIALSNL